VPRTCWVVQNHKIGASDVFEKSSTPELDRVDILTFRKKVKRSRFILLFSKISFKKSDFILLFLKIS
jgi:hypothetical protein